MLKPTHDNEGVKTLHVRGAAGQSCKEKQAVKGWRSRLFGKVDRVKDFLLFDRWGGGHSTARCSIGDNQNARRQCGTNGSPSVALAKSSGWPLGKIPKWEMMWLHSLVNTYGRRKRGRTNERSRHGSNLEKLLRRKVSLLNFLLQHFPTRFRV